MVKKTVTTKTVKRAKPTSVKAKKAKLKSETEEILPVEVSKETEENKVLGEDKGKIFCCCWKEKDSYSSGSFIYKRG